MSAPTSTFGASRGFGDTRPPLLASKRHTTRLVLVVCGIALFGFVQSHRSTPSPAGSHVALYLSIVALQFLFVGFVRKGIRTRNGSLRDLFGQGWRTPLDGFRDTALALLLVVALRGCAALLQYVLGHPLANTGFLLPNGALESLLWIGVSIVAGGCEEMVYRGYLQPQLWALSGSLPLSIALQALVFGLAHVYQGWRPAVITVVYGLAFGLLAAWRKSIIPGTIAHSFVDTIGGLAWR